MSIRINGEIVMSWCNILHGVRRTGTKGFVGAAVEARRRLAAMALRWRDDRRAFIVLFAGAGGIGISREGPVRICVLEREQKIALV
jgi:hypothetical protein